MHGDNKKTNTQVRQMDIQDTRGTDTHIRQPDHMDNTKQMYKTGRWRMRKRHDLEADNTRQN